MKFCVIGLGRLGFQVAVTLAHNGMEVLAVDKNEQIVAQISDLVTQSITMQVIDEASLHTLGVDEMDAVIVAVGRSFAQSILITALLKKRLKVSRVITRSIGNIHEEILKLVGADQIILPEQEMGIKIADKLSLPFMVLSRLAPDFSVGLINAPEPLVGKTIEEVNLLSNYQITCLGLKSEDGIIPITPEHVIDEHDKLICSGPNKKLQELSALK